MRLLNVKMRVRAPKDPQVLLASKSRSGTRTRSLERRSVLQEAMMRACLAEGKSREEIRTALNIDDIEYDIIERRLLETDAARFTNIGTAHRFYLFSLRQEQCIRELDTYIKNYKNDPKAAVVGAVKAKSQILETVMRMGQELGVIAKRAKELKVMGDINLAMVPTDELRGMYADMVARYNRLVENDKSLPSAYRKMLNRATETREPSDRSETTSDETAITGEDQ